MTTLETERLLLRPWTAADRDLFREINSDNAVMEYFPFRRTRAESGAFLDRLIDIQTNRPPAFQAVELRETGECLGFCGLNPANIEPFCPPEAIEISWRLARRYWGNGYVTEAALAWLGHGFDTLGLPEIVSFAVHGNRRSTAVMERIGMFRDPAMDFDHPRVPDTHPHLKRHVFYRLDARDWAKTKTAR
jgi:RimJ/RimL family protein N-acetyltransferase